MKRIGLLGGMSWESSVEYERIINQVVRQKLGGTNSADLVIRSFNFADIEALQISGDWHQAGQLLAEAAADLEAAGCDAVVLCTNTMHKVADQIVAAITVPFLHIADATAQAIVASGITCVGLLGTRYTMEQSFYRDRVASDFGIEVHVPNQAQRDRVNDIIFDELVQGIITEESRLEYLAIINELIAIGCTGIVAGCTEIELLVSPDLVSVPYFATARIHALAAAEFALS